MKYKVRKEEFKRVISDEIEVTIPEEPRYYWHNGIRHAYAVIPEWTSWNMRQYNTPEEIWQIRVVEVDPTDYIVKTYNIRLSEFTDILSRGNDNRHRLVENLLFYPDENKRSRECFMEDYNDTLARIADQLQFPISN